jgi:DNA-binding NtrC family response regulator
MNIASPMTEILKGLSILVVEDDFIVSTELEALLRDAGADSVYSCRTVGEATAVLDCRKVAVAVLDARIGGDSVAPVARKLAQSDTPFLFYTGQIAGDRIMAEWPDRTIVSKPASSQRIVHAVAGLLTQQAPCRAPAPRRAANGHLPTGC